ncbi:MAG: UbiA family prenyltransferase [Steroidobacteraceae bacterium]
MSQAPQNMDGCSTPLCVDLDGTLTPIDTLHESLLALAHVAPRTLLKLPSALIRGKAAFKRTVAEVAVPDVTLLPLREELVQWLQMQHTAGRQLWLVTAADRRIADAVAAHLGLFAGVICSDGEHNLAGSAKGAALIERFGERGFDYAGNESKDLDVWRAARRAIVIGSETLARRAAAVTEVEKRVPAQRASLKVWARALRLHQWAKNVLVFLPLLLAHQLFRPNALLHALLAFLAFGLCASSVYLVNDLFDLASDRRHPRKRTRPFASGRLPAKAGSVALLLLAAAALLASLTTPRFCALLAGYYALTWAYSIRLKRAALLDVMTLACLYTVRIVAGAAATEVPLSFWLLAFSVFIFLSLGIVKRYSEIDDQVRAGSAKNSSRGYHTSDLPLLLSLGTASGYCAIIVAALYIMSADSQALYRHTQPLWLLCPILLYWLNRIWLLTTRGQMPDDPVIFALRDRRSLVIGVLLVAIVIISI